MSAYETDSAKRQVRALVADDDPVLRSLVVANLEGRADEVTEAGDGLVAWDLLLSRPFELALIDLSMPNLDGFMLIQCMRGHPRTKHMPIIVITSHNDQASIERAFKAGASSFLTKPLNWALFGHHVDYLTRLSDGGQWARATMRQAEAVGRAQDAVIARLAARVSEHTTRIIAAAQKQQRPRSAGADSRAAFDFARSVLAEAIAISDVCDETLPHLRSVTEQIVIDDRPVPLERLLDESVMHATRLAVSRQVRIEFGSIADTAIIKCDATAVARALASLLRNAVQASEPGSAVIVSAEHRDDNVLAISVLDQGTGAEPALIAACLQPLDRFTRPGAGIGQQAGLGLPIAMAIAQAHGGTIEISTAPGEGTTAVLILPAEIVEVRHEDAA